MTNPPRYLDPFRYAVERDVEAMATQAPDGFRYLPRGSEAGAFEGVAVVVRDELRERLDDTVAEAQMVYISAGVFRRAGVVPAEGFDKIELALRDTESRQRCRVLKITERADGAYVFEVEP